MSNLTFPVNAQPTLDAVSDADVAGCTAPRWFADSTHVNVAADALIVTPDFESVLLIRRGKAPYDRGWAFPGGRWDNTDIDPATGEVDLGVTADREMFEETGVHAADAIARYKLTDVTSTTWDPRFVGAHVGATVYVMPDSISFAAADDASDAQWVRIDDLASGHEVLAFEHAQWLAQATAADGPLADPSRHEAFTALALAARIRNCKLISRVNAVRQAAGLTLIETDFAQWSADKAALRTLVASGRVTARIEPVTLTVAQRTPAPTHER